jgi:hypothetical protein
MRLEFGTTDELTNTQFAPVAALMVYYEAQKLTGCQYISVVNTKLRPERRLAQVKRIDHFAEQSTLALALNELTQMNLDQLEAAVRHISHRCSRTRQHDWRGFLTLDFDLSGLPCGKQAEASKKGYFSGKKTSPDDN